MKFDCGARYQGMGNSNVSIAYDANTVFSNPGALVWSKGVSVSLKDFRNICAGEAYPTGYGTTLGIGILLNSYQNLPGNVSISSNALLLSAGARADSILPLPGYEELTKNLGVGISIKALLGQSFMQSGQTDLSGSGWEMDAGALYRALPWMDLGGAACNLLPYQMLGGGRLNWNSASGESIPAFFKAGISAKVVGDIRSPVYWEDNTVMLTADLELSKKPLVHAGCEWTISDRYLLRAGLAQNLRQDEPQTDPSFGAGYRSTDWQFDLCLAREPLNGEEVFYLSVVYFPKEWFFLAHPVISCSLGENMSTFRSSIEVSGKVRPEVRLSVNSADIKTDAEGKFSTVVPLNPGDNAITLQTDYMGEKQSSAYSVLRKNHPPTPADIIFPVGTDVVFSESMDVSGRAADGIEKLLISGRDTPLDPAGNFTASIPLVMGRNEITVEGKYDEFSVSKSYTFYRKPPPLPAPAVLPEIKSPAGASKSQMRAGIPAEAIKKMRIPTYRQALAKIKSLKVKKAKKARVLARFMEYGTNRITRSQVKKAAKNGDKIYNYLQEAGYLDTKGMVTPRFNGNKESYSPSPGLSDDDNRTAYQILKKNYNPFVAAAGLPREDQWKALVSSTFSESYEDLPRAGKKPVSIYNFQQFGDKRGAIWNALIDEGYIDDKGRVLNKFDGNRRKFSVSVPLSRQEKDRIFGILLNPPRISPEDLKVLIRLSREDKQRTQDQARFDRLQELIEKATTFTITKKITLKMPKDYLAVYVITDGRYLALKYLGQDRVAVELYFADRGIWSTITYLPYSTIKNLI